MMADIQINLASSIPLMPARFCSFGPRLTGLFFALVYRGGLLSFEGFDRHRSSPPPKPHMAGFSKFFLDCSKNIQTIRQASFELAAVEPGFYGF